MTLSITQTNGFMEFFTTVQGTKVIILRAKLSSDSRDYTRYYRLATEMLRDLESDLKRLAA